MTSRRRFLQTAGLAAGLAALARSGAAAPTSRPYSLAGVRK